MSTSRSTEGPSSASMHPHPHLSSPSGPSQPQQQGDGEPLSQEQFHALLKQLPGVFTRFVKQGGLSEVPESQQAAALAAVNAAAAAASGSQYVPTEYSAHEAHDDPESSHGRPQHYDEEDDAQGDAIYDDHQEPASPEAPNPSSGGRRRKGNESADEWARQRKDNHKEVERRRRSNINDGITELARIVPNGGGEKAKGAILSRAVQYIHQLKENEARNIEKWTLEKLLMDQAMGDMQGQLREAQNQVRDTQAQLREAQAQIAELRAASSEGDGDERRPEKRRRVEE